MRAPWSAAISRCQPSNAAPETAIVESGDRIPDDIRQAIEQAHQTSLVGAAIDRSDEAAIESRRLDATAFTRDDTIHLPQAVGHIDSAEARGLIAHELTHIAQQRRLGAALPGKDSEEGRLLEAQARVAHQFFRGDAGAPAPQPLASVDRASLLTTGVADVDARGRVSYRPVSAELVQRQVATAGTPDYAWQQKWKDEHHPDSGIRGAFANIVGADSDPSKDTSAIEKTYVRDLNDYREEQRQESLTKTTNELQHRANADIGPVAPHIPEGLTAEEQAIAEKIRDAHLAILDESAKLSESIDKPTLWNKAVDDVDNRLPMRDSLSDSKAHHKFLPDPPDSLVVRQQELAVYKKDHQDLVHRVLGSAEGASSGGGAASSPSSPSSSSAPTSSTRSASTTSGSGPPSAGPSGPAAASSPGGATSHAGGAPSQPGGSTNAFSWEAGVFSETESVWGGLADALFGKDELTPEQQRAHDEKVEHDHIVPMRATRAKYFGELVDKKVDAIKREYHLNDLVPPADAEIKAAITHDEWQQIITTVETDKPLHDASPENRLLHDPTGANEGFRALVENAKAERPKIESKQQKKLREEKEAKVKAEGEAAKTKVAQQGAPAVANTPAQAPAHAAAHALGGAAVAGAGAALLHHEAVHAQAAGHTADAAHMSSVAQPAAGAPHATPLDLQDIEFSPELMRKLSNELYVRLRSRLRSELIIDRERSGVLTDFR